MVGDGNVPGAASADFWPIAAIQPQLALASPADAGYVADSPQPYRLRSLPAGKRMIGALQSAP